MLKNKKRNSNFELLRIVAMFMIVLYHNITHSNLIEYTTGPLNVAIVILTILCLVHVNLFMLITGYFQSKSTFKLSKLISLFIQIWFYNLLITVICQLTGITNYNNIEFLVQIFPLNFSEHWYIYCYVILYVFSPYLNKLINVLSKSELKKIILCLILCFSILPFFSNNLFYFTNGYTIIQFIIMYFIGYYIRMYDLNIHCNTTQKRFIYLFGYFICAAIHFLLYFASTKLIVFDSNIIKYFAYNFISYVTNYNNPIIMLQAICLFMFFKTFNFQNKFINLVASLTLGIYLITENYSIKTNLYHWIGTYTDSIVYGKSLLLELLFFTIIIFIGCSIIEFLRQMLFNLVGKIKVCSNIYNNFVNFLHRLFETK